MRVRTAGWQRHSYLGDAHVGGAGPRAYTVYVPRRLPLLSRAPVLVLLHGCSQSAQDIAAGTRVAGLADRHGVVVVCPEQGARDNRNRCWNWYHAGHQVRGTGEPAAVAGIVREVLASRLGARLDRRRVYVAGMSAGAAMAAILGATYPDLVAAVGVHSGMPYGAARTAAGALLAMRTGGHAPDARGRQVWLAMGEHAATMPMVVVHGGADPTVRPVNGEQVTRQWLATNRLVLGPAAALDPAQPTRVRRVPDEGGRAYELRTWDDGRGRPLVQQCTVTGLGHAWSGGSSDGTFTDPSGPDATALMWDFLRQQSRGRPARVAVPLVPVARRALGRLRGRGR